MEKFDTESRHQQMTKCGNAIAKALTEIAAMKDHAQNYRNSDADFLDDVCAALKIIKEEAQKKLKKIEQLQQYEWEEEMWDITRDWNQR